jgi:voltage-dependent calcium channel T type alpha-1G
MRRPPYYTNYGRSRLLIHNVVTSKYFDLAIAAVIGLNVVTMAMEFYRMPPVLKKMILFKSVYFSYKFITSLDHYRNWRRPCAFSTTSSRLFSS